LCGLKVSLFTLQNADNAAAIKKWQENDVEARALILSYIKFDKQSSLRGCKTAAEMWNRIKAEYALETAESIPLLWDQFYKIKPQTSNISYA